MMDVKKRKRETASDQLSEDEDDDGEYKVNIIQYIDKHYLFKHVSIKGKEKDPACSRTSITTRG